jgi:hypothetical protein
LIDLANQKITKLKTKQQKDNERQEDYEILPIKTILLNTQNQLQRERAVINELKANITTKHQA